MKRIAVLGGTGYAGANIVKVAAERGHHVTSISRSLPHERIDGVVYVTGDVLDPAVLDDAVKADVVVSALSPRGALEGRTRAVLRDLAQRAEAAGVRLGVVGGAGSLLVAEGGPMVADTPDFPDTYKAEAAEMSGVLDDLRASATALNWFFVSPAGSFGVWAPGEATGVYRVGGDILLTDDQGKSEISGADLADAIVNEIESPAYNRARFTVAY